MITIKNLAVLLCLLMTPAAFAGEPANIQQLLDQNNYAEIERLITNAAELAEKNTAQEAELTNLLDQFYSPQAPLQQKLDRWVKTRDKSHIPYLARGIYLTSMGWNQRGPKYISETTGKQLDGMQFYFENAYRDFLRSMEIAPKQINAQCYMMEILMNYGNQDMVDKLYRQALSSRPDSLVVRWYYLSTRLPRWGGTIEQMSSVVKAARPHHGKNPNLKILEGRLAAEQGDQAYFAGNYAEALQAYGQALLHGDHWYYLNKRGEVLLRTGQSQESITSFTKTIAQRPAYWRAYDQRGVAYQALGKHAEAIKDFTVGIRNNEGGSRLINARGESYLAMARYREALNDFEEALKQDPDNTDFVSNRNKAKSLLPAR